MHDETIDDWRHDHVFLGADHARNERRTWLVIALTAAMMVGEIAAGLVFGSMALLADGFHMATHAGALSITALAKCRAARSSDTVEDLRRALHAFKVADDRRWIRQGHGDRTPAQVRADQAAPPMAA